tara:strand:- start:115 stop:1227 length:1113 start_codon:yes stop_codon:yes gene_type:complete
VNILVLNWLDPDNPQAGGAEIHLLETFKRLVDMGHSVTLLCSSWKGAESLTKIAGIEVHRIGGRHTVPFLAPMYYRRHLRDRKFDVVVEDLNKTPFFSPWWVDVPVVLLVHHLFGSTAFREASFPVAFATWFLEIPIPWVFKGIPTIVVSQSTAKDMIRRGIHRDLIEIIPNGVDLNELTPGLDRDRFEEPTILYLGRLKRYKCIGLILRAMAILVGRGIKCRLLIAGHGDYRDRLEVLRTTLGLDGSVDFLGFVSTSRKIDLLRKSWVHVLASSKEGWGIANLEAAACGTPTVASDSPGLCDSILDGETGYLVPHGNIDDMANRILELIENEKLRSSMGEKGRGFAERFSWDESARLMDKFLGDRLTEK